MDLRLRVAQTGDYLRTGDVIGLTRKALYSESIAIGIRKDLLGERDARLATLRFQVRNASAEDIQALIGKAPGDQSDARDRHDRVLQRRVVERIGLDRCFIADDEHGRPSFMQYVFTRDDDQRIRAVFPGIAPPIQEGAGLVEFLYVPPRARVLSFVTDCLSLVADESRRLGLRSLLTFTPIGNRGALTALQIVGFRPFAIRRSTYRVFRKRTTYEPRSGTLLDLLREFSDKPSGFR